VTFLQRSFSSKSFRPRPLVVENICPQTWLMATVWGETSGRDLVVASFREYLLEGSSLDITRRSSQYNGLSENANRLLTAIFYANEQLAARENSKEYRSAVEVSLLQINGRVLHWAQLGLPHLILQTSQGLQPLACSLEGAIHAGQNAPLFGRALGLQKSCYPACGSYQMGKNDKIVCIARSYIPASFYRLEQVSLATCANALAADRSDVPFWLGILETES